MNKPLSEDVLLVYLLLTKTLSHCMMALNISINLNI